MDLNKLIAEVKAEDMDKLAEVLPLLKEKATLDRLIAKALGGSDSQAKPKDEAPAPTKTEPAKRRSRRKRATAKKVETQIPVETPKMPLPKAAAKKASPKATAKKQPVPKAAAAKPAPPAPKESAKKPASKTGAPSIKELIIAHLKGRKQAAMPEIVQAVADAKKIKVTPSTKNVVSVAVYKCKDLKKVAPGVFALA